MKQYEYEYECACGYIWIDDGTFGWTSENNGCPMCGETTNITAEPYESLPPDKLNRGP